MKKLLVTLFTVTTLSICLGKTVYASELETIALELAQEVVSEGTDLDIIATELEEESTDDESQLSVDNDLKQKEAEIPEGNMYVDEQGQVYYIELDEEKEAETKEEKEEGRDKKDKEKNAKEEKVEKKKKKKPTYSKEDLRLLAALIYAEAGNQSYEGMLAVANVVINRANSDVYWHVDTIKEVIYDNKWSVQFGVTIKNKKTGKSRLDKALECYDTGKFPGSNAKAEKKAMQRAIKAAKAALEGENNIGNFLCFNANRNTSRIKKKYDYKILGDHIFYRTK